MNIYIVSFLVIILSQGLFFLWAYLNQSDKITDLSYGGSFFLFVSFLFFQYSSRTTYQTILFLMISIWAIRLAGFLYLRIQKMGRDRRFDYIRKSAISFLGFWVMQAISIIILSLSFIRSFTHVNVGDVSIISIAGFIIWSIGMLLEVVSDYQKSQFKKLTKPPTPFIQSGLYSFVQFPNYLGEILVWIGIFIYCISSNGSAYWYTVISPLWIILILVKFSGIPPIEKSREEDYGGSESYQQYRERVKKLIPYVY